jgi:hypothetical protein
VPRRPAPVDAGGSAGAYPEHGCIHHRSRSAPTSDGEKPDRDRDGEFALRDDDPAELRVAWAAAWRLTLDTVAGLTPADLTREVTIRGEPHTVARALLRQVDHYAQHVGQIVMLAKHLRGPSWRTLSLATPPRRPRR